MLGFNIIVIEFIIFIIIAVFMILVMTTIIILFTTNLPDKNVEQSSEKEKKLLANFLEFVHNKFNAYTYIFFACELLNIVISVR